MVAGRAHVAREPNYAVLALALAGSRVTRAAQRADRVTVARLKETQTMVIHTILKLCTIALF